MSSHGRGAGADDSALTGRRHPRVDGALLLLAGVHVASRLAFWIDGVRFDASTLPWFWQFLDPAWLRTDLLRSLWYLHAQPPLFNAFLGIVLKLDGAAWMFQGIFFALGLALVLALYTLMRRLGVGRGVAFATALLYDLSPTAVIYENLLFYTELEAALLVGAALFLHRLAERRRTLDAALFFSCIAALALTRSLFHAVWFLACSGLALAASRPLRGGIVISFLLAALGVGGLYAKNAWVFGAPSGSSWFGMSLARFELRCWPAGDLRALVARGEVSPLILIPPFSPLERYAGKVGRPVGADVLALREPVKKGGDRNLNHIAYVELSRQYARDAIALIRAEPARYALCLQGAVARFMLPPSDYHLVSSNRQSLGGLDRLYDAVIYGVPRAWLGMPPRTDVYGPYEEQEAPVEAGELCWLWFGAGLLACATCARAAIRRPRMRATATVLAFCLFNIAFVTIAANAVELGENNRFRVAIEPLVAALIALAATELVRARARARG